MRMYENYAYENYAHGTVTLKAYLTFLGEFTILQAKASFI